MGVSRGAASAGPAIEVRPRRAVMDAPVRLRVVGVGPRRAVRLRARMEDAAGEAWESAAWRADERGVVDVARQPPLSGSYAGADPMGLFWSMAPVAPERVAGPFTRTGPAPALVTFTAEVDGAAVASAQAERRWVAPGVKAEAVRVEGLAGELFLPPGPGPHPAVVVLGGSAGGVQWADELAPLLASHGYAALALAYFGYAHLPAGLADVPLEYCAAAIRWLRAHAAVRGVRLRPKGALTPEVGRRPGRRRWILLLASVLGS